ncbi:30S ribosomal protein S8 [Candidatus Micrarchaeota archaeon]|nr:30S ribosomal protein S8 [Candidatus Micrarchaeota archaeon]
MDTVGDALNAIKVSEMKGKPQARIAPASKIIREVLAILQREGYVGEFEFIDDGKSGSFVVNLVGKINQCGVVKPRFSVKAGDWEKHEQRFLPAKGVGLLVVSTPKGIMTHQQAKEQALGGRLLAFVY